MESVRTVSLIYGYSARNAGDYAITLGALDILCAQGCKVKLFSRYRKGQKDFFQSSKDLIARYGDRIEIYESPFCLDRTDGIGKTFRNYFVGFATLIGLNSQSGFQKELLDSDVIVFNGGNLFRCHSFIDFTRLLALLFPLRIAVKNHKPYLIFPQSASKLNVWGRKILFPILKRAEVAMFRERQSFTYLQSMVQSDNFMQTIDLAFFIDKIRLPAIPVSKRKTVVITLRFYTVGDIKLFSDEEISRCYSALDGIIPHLSESYDVLVVVQTDKDEATSVAFAERHGLKIIKTNEVPILLSLYKEADLLIGMRLHSIILALSVGTPCLGLFYREWGLKNPGMMEYFDLPYLFMDDGPSGKDIIREIDNLLDKRTLLSERILHTVSEEKRKIEGILRNVFES